MPTDPPPAERTPAEEVEHCADMPGDWSDVEITPDGRFAFPGEPALSDDMVERATMALLGKTHDPCPGVDWHCDRQWRVNGVRRRMRVALLAALREPRP